MVGPLLPTDTKPPAFAQMYFYDTDNELNNRLNHVSDLDKHTLSNLQNMLHDISPFYRQFKTMIQLQKESPMNEMMFIFRADKGKFNTTYTYVSLIY